MRTPGLPSRRVLMWQCLVVFVIRVLGQIEVSLWEPSWLPPFLAPAQWNFPTRMEFPYPAFAGEAPPIYLTQSSIWATILHYEIVRCAKPGISLQAR
jgi:hypothetical protein